MYEVFVKRNFSAAHRLCGYEGDCSKLHGHNWKVTVVVESKDVDRLGIAMDFRKLGLQIDTVLKTLDHSVLNDIEAFKDENPTSENIARYIYRQLSGKISSTDVRLARIIVSESENTGVSYFE